MKRFGTILIVTCLVALVVSAQASAVINVSALGVNNSGQMNGRGWTATADFRWSNGVAVPGGNNPTWGPNFWDGNYPGGWPAQWTGGIYTGELPWANSGSASFDNSVNQTVSFVTPPIAPPSGTHQKALQFNNNYLMGGNQQSGMCEATIAYDLTKSAGSFGTAGQMKPTDPNNFHSGSFSMDFYTMSYGNQSQYPNVANLGFSWVFYKSGVGTRYVKYEPAYRGVGDPLDGNYPYTHDWNNVKTNVWNHEVADWNNNNFWEMAADGGSHYVPLSEFYKNNWGNFRDVVDQNWPMVGFQIGIGWGPTVEYAYINQLQSSLLKSNELFTFGQNVLAGDANGDGCIDLSDLTILAANWGDAPPARTWAQGDFTGEGNIDLSDLTILAANWAPCGAGADCGAALSTTAIPLPSAFGAGLALLGLGLGRRQR